MRRCLSSAGRWCGVTQSSSRPSVERMSRRIRAAPASVSMSTSGSASAPDLAALGGDRDPVVEALPGPAEPLEQGRVQRGVRGDLGHQPGRDRAGHGVGERRRRTPQHLGEVVGQRPGVGQRRAGRPPWGTRPRGGGAPCSASGGRSPACWCRPARRSRRWSGRRSRPPRTSSAAARSTASSMRGFRGRPLCCFHYVTTVTERVLPWTSTDPVSHRRPPRSRSSRPRSRRSGPSWT